MKLFVLISITLLAMWAQDQKPAAPMPVAAGQTTLTADEHDQLAIALMQAQAARIELLEKLIAKQAGAEDLQNSSAKGQAYEGFLASLRKLHKQADTCLYNFVDKQWACEKGK